MASACLLQMAMFMLSYLRKMLQDGTYPRHTTIYQNSGDD